MPITLAPLRERPEDILPLAEHFISRISVSDRLPIKPLTADAQAYLISQPWAGNVRELEGLIHRALVLSDAHEIDREVLEQIHESSPSAQAAERLIPSALHIDMRDKNGAFKSIAAIEAEAIQNALTHFHHNITHTAEALGMAKSTFYRKIKDAK